MAVFNVMAKWYHFINSPIFTHHLCSEVDTIAKVHKYNLTIQELKFSKEISELYSSRDTFAHYWHTTGTYYIFIEWVYKT